MAQEYVHPVDPEKTLTMNIADFIRAVTEKRKSVPDADEILSFSGECEKQLNLHGIGVINDRLKTQAIQLESLLANQKTQSEAAEAKVGATTDTTSKAEPVSEPKKKLFTTGRVVLGGAVVAGAAAMVYRKMKKSKGATDSGVPLTMA